MELNRDKANISTFSIEISTLKAKLNIETKYSRFCNFKERVLEKAKKEINKFSDLSITYTVNKKGRSPDSIEFKIMKKNVKKISKSSMDIELDISPAIIEKAKFMALNAGTGWDIQEIKKQFFAYKKSKGETKDIDAAFLGFTKKKILTQA
jgi:plasmid replication initiation protein